MTVRDLVISERNRNPCATLQQIGDKYSVTKEWVRQILSEEELPTRHWRRHYICNNCGITFFPGPRHSKLFCKADCRKSFYSATVECAGCGRLYTTSYLTLTWYIVNLGQQRFYCSKSCLGKTLGLQHGFAVHPENRYEPTARQPSKWRNYLPCITRRLDQGEELTVIIRELGIPRGSYALIKALIAEKGAVSNTRQVSSPATEIP